MSLDQKSDNSDDADALRVRRDRIAEILAGSLPTTYERLVALPPCKGSETEDQRLFVRSLAIKHKGRLDQTGLAMLDLAESDASVETLRAARELMLAIDSPDSARRFQLYAALAGDTASAWPLGGLLVTSRGWRFSVDRVHGLALGLGLLAVRAGQQNPVDSLVAAGLADLRSFAEWIVLVDAATDALDRQQDDAAQAEAQSVVVGEIAAVTEASVEGKATSEKEEKAGGARPTLVVVPHFAVDDKKRTSAARDVAKAFESIAGKHLPLVQVDDPAAICSALALRFPHFLAELELVLRRPLPWRVMFVGDPGSGKTELARSLADVAGLPFLVYSCAGSTDSSFGGTSAQWATARASLPLQVIQRNRTANPLVILDELDKASPDRRNGAIVDVLLGYLEPASAKRLMDLGLELEVDVSQVSYVATANRVEDVPAPLRDRLKIVRMPTPGLKHFDHFVSNIFDEIARERGIDRRWISDLAQDEAEVVQEAWPGGSLRRLRRILELLIDGRDDIMGRA